MRVPLALLLVVVLAPVRAATAQGLLWTAKQAMPEPRVAMGAVAFQGEIWILGGYSGSTLSSVVAYDPATDSWSVKTPMPTARALLVAAVANGKIYAIGGFQSWALAPATFTPVTEEYDPLTDT